jgi:hypothetical protein
MQYPADLSNFKLNVSDISIQHSPIKPQSQSDNCRKTSLVECYFQDAIGRWLEAGRVVTLEEAKRLTFEVSSHTLAGFEYDSVQEQLELIQIFDEFTRGLFSMRIDLPGFQFHKAMYLGTVVAQKPYVLYIQHVLF